MRRDGQVRVLAACNAAEACERLRAAGSRPDILDLDPFGTPVRDTPHTQFSGNKPVSRFPEYLPTVSFPPWYKPTYFFRTARMQQVKTHTFHSKI